jgi:signal transduction histidine kinase/DNA-binding NarL/FixJ family response regulator
VGGGYSRFQQLGSLKPSGHLYEARRSLALTRSKLKSPRARLTASYGIALTIIAALSIATHFILGIVISDQREVAQIVNMTGRQRMLSQRTAWLAARYAQTGDPSAHSALRETIDEMAGVAERLRNGAVAHGTSAALPPGVAQIYKEQNVDRRIDEYLTHARGILETEISAESPLMDIGAQNTLQAHVDAITAEAAGPILTTLNSIVTEYVAESDQRIARLQEGQRYTLIVVILTLIAEAFFIFRPMAGRISTYLDRILERSQRANAARRAAQRADAAKSSFLTNMSHELRTPLTGIMGMCDLLLSSTQPPQQVKVTRTLRQSAQTLLDLVTDLLDLAKIEGGRLALDPVDFKLSAVLTEVRDLFDPSMTEKGLRFVVDPPPEDANILYGDPKRLRQALCNLVGNALKFTSSGTVHVRSSFETDADGALVVTFVVSDSGIGISDESLNRLFAKFEQIERATRRFGGTGLGLAITKQIAESMGGQIGVESTKGQGSRFWFSVRLDAGDPVKIAEADAATPAQAGRILEGLKLKLLVAEDHPTTQFLLEQMFTMWGHDVVIVGDGQLAVARAESEAFDVILMDMQMPVMDGDAAAKRIRAGGGACAKVPIIALTADGIPEHWKKYMAAGCDTVVTKPVSWPHLTSQIEALLDPERRASVKPEAPAERSAGAVHVLNPVMFGMLKSTLPTEVFHKIVRAAVESIDKHKATLESEIAAMDQAKCKRTAHTLKGLSVQIGADEVASVAQWIEQHAEGIDPIRGAIPKLESAIVRLRTSLQTEAVLVA